MEDLPADQQEQLKKCSTDRLRIKLAQAGVDEEAVCQMDRPKLLEAMARVMLEYETKQASVAESKDATEIRLRELDIEQKRLEAEQEHRRMQSEQQQKRIDAELRMKEIEAEIKQKQMEYEKEMRLMELQAKVKGENQENVTGAGHDRQIVDDSLASRTKRFGETMKHVLPKMPTDNMEIPQFFDTVEKLYAMYEVPDDLQAKLLIPLLTGHAKSLIGRMSASDMEQYVELKKFLLTEFKLTPKEYKFRFDSVVKNSDETYVMFTARLRNLLDYYLRSRDIGNDFDKLCDLLISDRLKSCLPNGPLNYVLSLEGNDWFASDKVASLSDIYVNNHKQMPSSGHPRSIEQRPRSTYVTSAATNVISSKGQQMHFAPGNVGRGSGIVRRCFRCNSASHLAKSCPHGRGRGITKEQSGKASVNRVGIGSSEITVKSDVKADTSTQWTFSEFPAVDAVVTSCGKPTSVKILPLKFVNVTVAGNECIALSDSGAQIPVISKHLFDLCKRDVIGNIEIKGIVGQSIKAPLVNVNVRLSDMPNVYNITVDLPLVCAVVDINATDYDVILPTDIIEELHKLPVISVVTPSVCDVSITDKSSVDSVVQSGAMSDDIVSVDHPINDSDMTQCDVDTLVSEQKSDDTLSVGWLMAREHKGGYIISRGMLFHNDKVEGQPVCQLCVPKNRRDHVLKLAHDSVFGGHMGERKTRERIKLSFHWPKLRQSVQEYVSSCRDCQLRSRVRTTDRVPITPITRTDIPFQVLYMDCIGPIDPPSANGHKYCLCIVDNCTRWPAVYLLKSLTAKAVCDALIDLFVNVGVASVIVSDCGTNFTSQLTRELLLRLGCSPRFNTPGHPEASGLVERFNQTCKNMLHHVIQLYQRQWYKYVPFMVWALREVPNSTTGMSPYMLVYGRTPRGPLTVLKETWTGEREIPPNLGKPVEEYLNDLKSKLETAAKFAQQHTKQLQAEYAAHYNLRARQKRFEEGDQVIILAPEGGSKLNNRWQGPGTIVKVKSPYSYLVDIGNGCVRHVHANKIRKFIARVQGCGVIAESDIDFGRVLLPVTYDDSCLPSNRIDSDKLSHLDDHQRKDLLRLLDEFSNCFNNKPGLCDVVTHRIVTTQNFVPKQMRPYRVPEVFKSEVDRQIKELLAMGLIQPSLSPMASPIVCVSKKDGGVRIAVDYRYLNSFTIGDAFPMSTTQETLLKLGNAKFISTFDAKSGYWQIPIAEQDRWLTAFVTHDGLFEWLRMPFGLKNAGATFVRAVRMILQPVREFCESYVDDMGVGSVDWPEHVKHLRQYLCVIRDVGLTLNLSKCDFAKAEVKFVGHFVGSGMRRPDPQRLEGIAKMVRPQTRKELRQLLGAFGYYRDYIPSFARVAKPLTDLTSKKTPNILPWDTEHQEAFIALRDMLCTPHVLRIPRIGKPFVLHTDANGCAVGATLSQFDDDGVEQPLAFASQKLSGPQCSWATIEREAYAIIWALNRFRDIIFGARITVYCDHNPLQYIRECSPKSAKLLRWSLALQEFDIEMKYIKGSCNVVADYLSRHV